MADVHLAQEFPAIRPEDVVKAIRASGGEYLTICGIMPTFFCGACLQECPTDESPGAVRVAGGMRNVCKDCARKYNP